MANQGFPWGFAGSALLAGANVYSGVKQAQAARENVGRTNKANLELAKYQFSKNKEMWELMKEYNSPSEQMKRFKEAGLNPNLIYGQGSPGNVQTYPEYQAPQLDYTGRPSVAGAAVSGGASGLYQGAQEFQKIQQMRANIKSAEVDAWLKDNTKSYKRAQAFTEELQAKSEYRKSLLQETRLQIENRIANSKRYWREKGLSPDSAQWLKAGILSLKYLGASSETIQGIMDELDDAGIPESELNKFQEYIDTVEAESQLK